jgi:hypothetical protein
MKNKYIILTSVIITLLIFSLWGIVYAEDLRFYYITMFSTIGGLSFLLWIFISCFGAIHSFNKHKIWTILILISWIVSWNLELPIIIGFIIPILYLLIVFIKNPKN